MPWNVDFSPAGEASTKGLCGGPPPPPKRVEIPIIKAVRIAGKAAEGQTQVQIDR